MSIPVQIKVDPAELGVEIEDIEDALSELISKKTGYCHKGFRWTINIDAFLDTDE